MPAAQAASARDRWFPAKTETLFDRRQPPGRRHPGYRLTQHPGPAQRPTAWSAQAAPAADATSFRKHCGGLGLWARLITPLNRSIIRNADYWTQGKPAYLLFFSSGHRFLLPVAGRLCFTVWELWRWSESMMCEDFDVADRWRGETLHGRCRPNMVAIATRHADAIDV